MTSHKPTRAKRTKATTAQRAGVSKPRKKKLSPKEEKHRYVLANMEEGYYEFDLNGNFTFVNPAMCLGMGYDAGELLGKNYRQCVTPESAEKLEATLTKIHGTGVAAKIVEYELVQKDGNRRRHEMSASLLRNAAGEPVGFFGISRDRTEALRLESALRESEASYRGVMDLCPDTITINETQTSRYVDINKAFTRHTGYRPEEVIGRTPSELSLFASPEDQRRLGLALRQGSIDGLEIRFRSKDGIPLENLLSGRRIQFKGKDCFLFVATAITPLKKIQQALRESEKSYRRILESAPYSIVVTRLSDSRYQEVNEAFCRRTGFSREEAIGHTSYELNIFVDPTARERMLNAFRRNGSVEDMEVQFRAKNGRILESLFSVTPISYHGDDCLLAITVDITERKRIEQELAQYRQHLEEMVQARTQALEAAQNELVKSEKLAVLGQLTATVSHELRNPLGVIRSSNFFLQRKITDRDEKVEKHFRRIEEQVALCDAIVADLLEFTRGRTVSMVKEDPTPWLIQAIEQLQESQGIAITQELARPLPAVPHDPEKMRRAVINVLDNAIQAVKAKMSVENGGPTDFCAQVSVKSHFADNKVVIEVTDNGVGMAPDTLQRAFEPLFTTRARGTGIGLAIVKKVVNEHGGDVFLKSTLGKGTHVTLALPCRVQPQGGHGRQWNRPISP